jgi:integrase
VNIADFREGGTVLRLQRQRMSNGTLAPLKARGEDDFRDVPVPAMLWAKVQAAPRDADGWLFQAESRSWTMKKIKAAKDAAGLPAEFVYHWLRHMYASKLLEDGCPITDVAKILGHQDVKITFAVYGRHTLSGLENARRMMDSAWAA